MDSLFGRKGFGSSRFTGAGQTKKQLQYDSFCKQENLRSKSTQSAEQQLESHKMYLKRVRSAHECSCKQTQSVALKQLRDQV